MDIELARVRIFESKTTATLEDDGIWKVVVGMYESISEDGEKFENKKLEVMGMNKDYEKAYETALSSLLRQYADVTGGSGSLFLEKGNDTKVNKDTQT